MYELALPLFSPGLFSSLRRVCRGVQTHSTGSEPVRRPIRFWPCSACYREMEPCSPRSLSSFPCHLASSWAWPMGGTGRRQGHQERETSGASPMISIHVSNSSSSGRVYPVAAQGACCRSGFFQGTLGRGFCQHHLLPLSWEWWWPVMLQISRWSYSPFFGISDLLLPVQYIS